MEFIVQKIGMSRIITTPSVAVTLLKVLNAKVCEIKGIGAKSADSKGADSKSAGENPPPIPPAKGGVNTEAATKGVNDNATQKGASAEVSAKGGADSKVDSKNEAKGAAEANANKANEAQKSGATTQASANNKANAKHKGNVAIVAYPKGKGINKAIAGNQKKYNLSKEFNHFVTLNVANAEPGDLDTSSLESNKIVKISFKTKGRGFSGAMKRWNFQGGPAAHGSRFHRRLGSIGNREWPGRVQPGKKMAGHYGDELVSVRSEIISYDKSSGVLVLKGSVPGFNGAYGKIEILNKTKK